MSGALVTLERWKLKYGQEANFIRAWDALIQARIAQYPGFMARLHRCSDSVMLAYNHWPSAAVRDAVRADGPASRAAYGLLAQTFERKLDEAEMTLVLERYD